MILGLPKTLQIPEPETLPFKPSHLITTNEDILTDNNCTIHNASDVVVALSSEEFPSWAMPPLFTSTNQVNLALSYLEDLVGENSDQNVCKFFPSFHY